MVFSKYCSKFGPLVNAYFYEVKYVGKKTILGYTTKKYKNLFAEILKKLYN